MLHSESSKSPSQQAEQSEEKFSQEPNKQPRSKRQWPLILGVILLILGAGGGWNWWTANRASKAPSAAAGAFGQPQAIPVKIKTVETATVEESSELVGTPEARRSIALKPKSLVELVKFLVREGDRLQQGQVIVQLDSDNLQAELFLAQATLEQAKARLAELQAGTRIEEIAQARANFQQTLARLTNAQAGARPEEIAQAQAQLEAAQSEADLAQERVNRYGQLREQGAISADQFDEYSQQERSTSAALREAERRLSQLRKSRSSDIDELEAAAEQARQNLRQLENGPRLEEIAQASAQVAQATAQVSAAQANLLDTKIVAPSSGVIGDIPVKVGDYVAEGDQLTTLTENNVLELNISVPLERASDLRLGLPVEILNAQGKAIATGEVNFISPDVNANSQVVLAKAAFANASGALLNQQFVQTRVIWNKRPGILIPATAISRLGGEAFVFVAQPSGAAKTGEPQLVARQQQVKLGAIQGNDYQVLEGLKPGETIVVAGLLNLADGMPIQSLKDEG